MIQGRAREKTQRYRKSISNKPYRDHIHQESLGGGISVGKIFFSFFLFSPLCSDVPTTSIAVVLLSFSFFLSLFHLQVIPLRLVQ